MKNDIWIIAVLMIISIIGYYGFLTLWLKEVSKNEKLTQVIETKQIIVNIMTIKLLEANNKINDLQTSLNAVKNNG